MIKEKEERMKKIIRKWDKEEGEAEDMRKRITKTEGKGIKNKKAKEERERIRKIVEEWEKVLNVKARKKNRDKWRKKIEEQKN